MAYIPPHKKRHSGEGTSSTTPNPPCTTPDSLSLQFNHSLNFSSFSHDNKNRDRHKGGPRIVYAPNASSKWFPVGLPPWFDYSCSDDDDTLFMSLTKLEPFSLESYETRFGAKPLTLVLDHDRIIKDYGGEGMVLLENPWEFAAQNLKQDLLSALQRVRDEMKEDDFEKVKPSLVARFGRVIFHGGEQTASGRTSRLMKGSFNTNVSPSFVEHVVNEVIPKLKTDAEHEKESYVVQLSDNMEPDSTISCTCNLGEDGTTLQLYKIQWNQVRHWVADMSCLGKRLDLRFMLFTKSKKVLSDVEFKSIQFVIGSAILDPEVKGGLRWPFGADSSGDRYTVVGVWHMNSKSFKNSSIKVKVRHAERFDFRSLNVEVAREVTLPMYGFVPHSYRICSPYILKGPIEDDMLYENLRAHLKLIWDYIL